MSILTKPVELMARRLRAPANRWAVLLAGGQGTRMREWLRQERGVERPKQFCSFGSPRSMLQITLDRARQLVPEKQIITVVTGDQDRFLDEALDDALPGTLLRQPEDRGTAAALLLAAARVASVSHDGTLIVLPCDHFMHPETRFCDYANRACQLVEEFPDHLVLLGAQPDGPETDYGWIVPRPAVDTSDFHSVDRFREKPGREEAERLLREGGVWNTLVLAVKAHTILTVARHRLPDMADRFDALVNVLRASRTGSIPATTETAACAGIYRYMTPADLSRDVLRHVAPSTLVLPMSGVLWSDWGRPERVARDLAARAPRRPARRVAGASAPFVLPSKFDRTAELEPPFITGE